MNGQRNIYLIAIVAIAGMLLAAAWQVSKSPDSAISENRNGNTSALSLSDPQNSLLVKIEDGENADSIATKLEETGVIRSALQFRVLVALQGVESELGAGDYRFTANMPASQVIEILINGYANFGRRVTIPEGLRAEEIADILEGREIVNKSDFLQAIALDYRDEFDFLRDLPARATLEGYLFPDTYDFPPNIGAEDTVRMLLENFGERFSRAQEQGIGDTGLSIHEVVTLASIVEREAVVPEESALIAGVFFHRIQLGMLLDADPTVQYALANDPASRAAYGYWKLELTVEDLRLDSPYNTRRYPDLPPGPISNPGVTALAGALNPTITDFLYFVAKPDSSHAFAETLDEHIDNIEMYQN